MFRRSLKSLLFLVGALYLLAPIVVALLRLGHPFQLEWMEGGSLDEMRRVVRGEALYVAPSLEYVPMAYAPLYYWAAAALARFLGDSFVPLRALSLAAALGVLALVARLVWRETRDGFAAFLAAGLFAATWRIAGAWWDLARCDMLFLFLVMLGALQLRAATRAAEYAVAGVLFALAFLTKQTALFVALPLAVAAALLDRRAGWWFGATFAALSLAAFLAIDRSSDGWFRFYAFTVPFRHGTVRQLGIGFWSDRIAAVGTAATLGGWQLVRWLQERRRAEALFYGGWAAGMLGASWLGLLSIGGGRNVMLPAYALVAVLFGLAMHDLLAREDGRTRWPAPVGTLALMLALVQLTMLAYRPDRQVPTAAARRAGAELARQLAATPGDVFMPFDGYLGVAAGKRPSAHQSAVEDLLGIHGRHDRGWEVRWAAMLRAAYESGRYRAAILRESPEPVQRDAGLERWFVRADPPVDPVGALRPVTGTPPPREAWYVPRPPRAAPADGVAPPTAAGAAAGVDIRRTGG